jgi:hypothetical protein
MPPLNPSYYVYKRFNIAYINKGHNAPTLHMHVVLVPTTNIAYINKGHNAPTLHMHVVLVPTTNAFISAQNLDTNPITHSLCINKLDISIS